MSTRRLAVVALLVLPLAAQDDHPYLCIDPGGPTAPVWDVLFTPDGRELISVGEDKVIRIWQVATGQVRTTLHPPIGPGSDGGLYAAALSPDGRLLAVGGYGKADEAGAAILLVDLSTERAVRLLRGHGGVVLDLAFSPDGAVLASSSGDQTVRLWNAATGEEWQRLEGHGEQVAALAWAPDGSRLASASHDRTVRVWSLDGGEPVLLNGHGDEVCGVAWSPDGATIATGCDDRRVRLFGSATGQLRASLPALDHEVKQVAISPDGRWLAASTGKQAGVHLYELATGQEVRAFAGHNNTVLSLTFSPDSRLIASAGGDHDEILLWDSATGEVQRTLEGTGRVPWAVAWSPSGAQLAWGLVNVGDSWRSDRPLARAFDLSSLTPLECDATGDWRRAVHRRGTRELVRDEDRNGARLLDGDREVAALKLGDRRDLLRCGTLLPEGGCVLGSSFDLQRYDAAGETRTALVGHAAETWALAPSPDGRYLASSGGDHTVLVWPLREQPDQLTPRQALSADWITWLQEHDYGALLDAPDGLSRLRERFGADDDLKMFLRELAPRTVPLRPLLALFTTVDGEWVAWTPAGYYACSPGGERLIGWQVNRGDHELADYYPAYQFRRRFYRPDVISRLLEAGSVAKAVELADTDRRDKTDQALVAAAIRSFAPPTTTILAPADGAVVTTPQVTVHARLSDPNRLSIKRVDLLLNGRNESARMVRPAVSGPSWEQTVSLVSGENRISLVAVNEQEAESVPASITVTYRPPAAEASQPSLYVLAVGVSQYAKDELSLRYAAKDATDLAGALAAQQERAYRQVTTRVLTDQQAALGEILDGVEWLQRAVTARDTAVVFLAGHGLSDAGQYYYLPADGDPARLLRTALKWNFLLDELQRLPGRVILAMDTCHAQAVTGTRGLRPTLVVNDALRAAAATDVGLITLASCQPQEVSLEREDWSNGAFTKALVEALSGQADANADGRILLAELELYVLERVKTLTEGRQHPSLNRPPTIPGDLELARTR